MKDTGKKQINVDSSELKDTTLLHVMVLRDIETFLDEHCLRVISYKFVRAPFHKTVFNHRVLSLKIRFVLV